MTAKEQSPTPAPGQDLIRDHFIETLEHNKSNGLLKMWWRADGHGYTYNITDAGLYSKHEAQEIVRKAEGRERMWHVDLVQKMPLWNVIQNID